MEFEWDDDKAASNERKHGVTFPEAQTVFADPLFLDFYDPAHSDDEQRYLIIGRSAAGNLLLVSYTERAESTRIISVRPATHREQRAYEEETQ